MAQNAETLDALFVNLVMIFKTAAFQQLGKTLNPMTGKVEKNLEQARFSIDMIEMLQEKTRGNLSKELDRLLDSTLLELRMNYVEEAAAKAGPGEGFRAEKEAGTEPDMAGSGVGTGEAAEEPGSTPEDPGAGKPEGADSAAAGSGDKKKGRKGGKKA